MQSVYRLQSVLVPFPAVRSEVRWEGEVRPGAVRLYLLSGRSAVLFTPAEHPAPSEREAHLEGRGEGTV